MRAIQLRAPGGLERLEGVEIPEPAAPAAGEITVKVSASSLNYHDYKVVLGDIKAADRRIPMSDGSGVVTAVGAGVSEFKLGDAVMSMFQPKWLDGERVDSRSIDVPGDGADGFACEAVTAPVTAFTQIPRGYTHAEAATLPCAALTAWRCLVPIGQLKAGDWVLVQGSGGVSVFALQFAKAMGARVIATSSSDAKLERLRDLGADHLLNYSKTPKWGSAARELSGGGVDHVVEVGGPGTLAQSIAAVRNGGVITLIGVLTGVEGPVPTALLMSKQVHLQGVTVGSRKHQLDMVRAIEATNIRPVIDSRFPLADIAKAFRHQAAGAHFGKIVLEI